MKPGRYELTITKRAFSSYVTFSSPEYREFCTMAIDNENLDTMSEFCAIGWEPTTRKLVSTQLDNIIGNITKMRNLPIGTVCTESVELLF